MRGRRSARPSPRASAWSCRRHALAPASPRSGVASSVGGVSATTNAPADAGMTEELLRYLQQGRDALLRSLDGLDDYDVRRPLTPSGTNLLGLVKHVAGVRARLSRRLRRAAVGRAAAVGRGRLDLGLGRHVGDRRGVARGPRRALPPGVGALRRRRAGAAARRPGERRVVARGAAAHDAGLAARPVRRGGVAARRARRRPARVDRRTRRRGTTTRWATTRGGPPTCLRIQAAADAHRTAAATRRPSRERPPTQHRLPAQRRPRRARHRRLRLGRQPHAAHRRGRERRACGSTTSSPPTRCARRAGPRSSPAPTATSTA